MRTIACRTFPIVLALIAGCCLFAGSSAGSVTNVWDGDTSTNWFANANWSRGAYPTPGETVIVPGGTTFAPTLTNATGALESFYLKAGQTLTVMGWASAIEAGTIGITGTVTHAANTVAITNSLGVWTPLHRIWLKGSNITVAASGVLNADYLGYPPGKGPGAGVGSGGAGHAGEGRRGFGGSSVAPAYGEPDSPWQPGSGGGPSGTGGTDGNSRPGGGSIRIEATGQLRLDGQLRARGQNAAGTHGRGASGGSIWLNCHILAGSATGLISVDGGNGNYYGAPGSAGRIALHYDPAAQAVLAEPRPPIRFSGKGGLRTSTLSAEVLPSAMATLYLSDEILVTGSLDADRFQYTRLVVPGFTNWTTASLMIDDCILGLPDGLSLAVAGDLVLTNGARLHLFAAPVADVLADAGAEVSVGGNLVIAANSWLQPYADSTNGATVMISVTGNLSVAANGGIDADYLGYTFGKGPGTPVSLRGGAGYGGYGGQGNDGALRGDPYGNPDGPIQAGSGGGNVPTLTGQGGGAIRLTVGGKAEINGLITACGAPGIANHGPAGSGGGIELTCNTLAGNATGLLRAEGGQGSYYGGSGGGGRIVVVYDTTAQAALPTQPAVRFSTYAFPDTTVLKLNYKAEMGTLFLPDKRLLEPDPGAPVVLAGQRFWHTRLMLPDWTSWAPAALAISNCVISFVDGFHLDVAGNLTLGDNAGLILQAVPTNDLYGTRLDVGGDLMIGSGSWIYPHAHGAAGSIVGLFVGGDVRVDDGGGINADGKGWFSAAGNTQGPGAGQYHYYGGGGYGGKGGGTSYGSVYGLAALPLQPGSPGGHNYRGGAGLGSSVAGKGGGAIHLIAGGNARFDGLLTADGYPGTSHLGSGGSGGAIFVSLGGRLTGNGTLRARGVIDIASYTSGGGGRIAVWPRMTPAAAAQRIAATNISRLIPSDSIASFAGDLDSGVPVSTTNPQAEAGTAGFYAVGATLFMIR